MILHDVAAPRDSRAADFCNVPAELAALTTWACWRGRTKNDTGRPRVVPVPVHPFKKHEPRKGHPGEWASFEDALNPRLRKPVDGIGVLLTQDSGLGVVINAAADLAVRLGDQVVYAERALQGGGLTLIVRAGVLGAVTNRFVPLAGQGAYQAAESPEHAACQDAGRTPAGHEPCHENRPCQDTGRTLVSCSPEDINGGGGARTVAEQLAELGRQVSQEKKSIQKWAYSLITVLKANRLSLDGITPALLQDFAAVVGVDADEVYRKVLLLWDRWRNHEVLLADARRAVEADPSLLDGLRDRVVDEKTLLVAGMARFLGAEGQPFALDQRTLAKVVGLSGQQAASDLLALLLKAPPLLEVVERGRYTAKKSAVYRWVGPGAVEPRPASEVAPTTHTCVTAPLTQAPAAPSPSRPAKRRPSRPGQSWTWSKTHPYTSLAFQGGYVTLAVHLAETMLERKLAKDRRTLPSRYWEDVVLAQEYESQLVAARKRLKVYPKEAVLAAINAPDAKSVYSLWPGWVEDLIKKQVRVVLHKQAVLAERVKEAASNPPPPPPAGPQAPRPAFVQSKSLLSKLKGT